MKKQKHHIGVSVEARANLPTEFGKFEIISFSGFADGKDHVAIVKGDVAGHGNIPIRIHSECLTGDALGSLRCDCRPQLIRSLRAIGKLDRGVVLYLRQEGRGIGLANKIKAYALQDGGLDTQEANVALGFKPDQRDYTVAAQMLVALGVGSVQLMTNNPEKLESLQKNGVVVTKRVPHQTPPNIHNKGYLKTKAEKFSHMLVI
jgi:GTP cyclohydrolase II